MNNILITIKKELRTTIRDKKSLLMMAITPIFIPIFVFLLSYMYEELTANNKNIYQIGTNYTLSNEEKNFVSEDLNFIYYSDINTIKEEYNKKNITAYIIKDYNNYNIYTNSASEDGSLALARLTNYLDTYNTYLGRNYLINNNINIDKVYNNINYSVNEIKGESLFANEVILITITFTIMAITLSAIYSATDSTAGEKERGTLETILTFPITRRELIIGKYLSISISGFITMIISIILSFTSLVVAKNYFSLYDGVIFNINLTSISLTVLILICYTLFVSGLCIAIASFTKSFKEAQSTLTPISLVTCIPMFLEMLKIKSSGVLSYIPIINHTIITNDILLGNIDVKSIIITIISSIIYIIVLLYFIIKVYKSEKVLFS